MRLLEETLPDGVLPFGRIPVQSVRPLVDGGTCPAKSVEHEDFIVAAQVFREGHDAVNATAVLTDPDGVDHHYPMHVDNPGLSWWSATVAADRPGWWTYRVEGWSDPWGTWVHDATIKVEADVDAELMLEEGARMLERCLAEQGDLERSPVREAIAVLRDTGRPAVDRLHVATSAPMRTWFGTLPRDGEPQPRIPVARRARACPVRCVVRDLSPLRGRLPRPGDRPVAVGHAAHRGGAAARHRRDGFRRRLPHARPPHRHNGPQGEEQLLDAKENDPGSPYAIGSPDGGHDSIHPDLGTFEDFDLFVRAARRNGLEVAIDIALQASPTTRTSTYHPEWFTTRADGTIAYAENPPKKYQDIYPLNFDNRPAPMRRCVASSRCGSTTASRCSASTTRTPSRCSSGSG